VGHEKRGRMMYYKVRWRGYNASHDTYEPRTELVKEVPRMVDNYDKKNKL
jgi:hypothetical protein